MAVNRKGATTVYGLDHQFKTSRSERLMKESMENLKNGRSSVSVTEGGPDIKIL